MSYGRCRVSVAKFFARVALLSIAFLGLSAKVATRAQSSADLCALFPSGAVSLEPKSPEGILAAECLADYGEAGLVRLYLFQTSDEGRTRARLFVTTQGTPTFAGLTFAPPTQLYGDATVEAVHENGRSAALNFTRGCYVFTGYTATGGAAWVRSVASAVDSKLRSLPLIHSKRRIIREQRPGAP